MVRRARRLICAMLLIVSASGCGSVLNQGFTPCGTNPNAHRIYGGVRTDLHLAGDAVVDPFAEMIAGRSAAASRAFMVLPFALAFCAVDLPLCAAVDTVTLPFDFLHVCSEWNWKLNFDRPKSDDGGSEEADSGSGSKGTVLQRESTERLGTRP